MTTSCPRCGSSHIHTHHTARRAGQTSGTVAGTASDIAGALKGASTGASLGIVAGPAGSVFGSLLGALVGGVVGGGVGKGVGACLGDQIGMQWHIHETPVRYLASDGDTSHTTVPGTLYGEAMEFPEQKVLYRSDNKAALSVVSQRYKVVQPQEVLEFDRDLTEVAGYELETAGVLKAGRRFWALARTGQSMALKGDDLVQGYLLLATSCDGSLNRPGFPGGRLI